MNIGQGGGPNCSLSETGQWQVEQIPAFFKEIPIKKIYCSPLRRTIMTALPLAESKQQRIVLIPEMSEIFNEEWKDYRDYDWEGCAHVTSSFPQADFIATQDLEKQWWPVWPENHAMVRARVQRFFDAELVPYLGTDDHIVVVGHGQSTADLKQIANPGDTIPVYNAGIVEFELDENGVCQSAKVHTEHLGAYVTE